MLWLSALQWSEPERRESAEATATFPALCRWRTSLILSKRLCEQAISHGRWVLSLARLYCHKAKLVPSAAHKGVGTLMNKAHFAARCGSKSQMNVVHVKFPQTCNHFFEETTGGNRSEEGESGRWKPGSRQRLGRAENKVIYQGWGKTGGSGTGGVENKESV